MNASPCRARLLTPDNPGAVAILQLHGPGAADVLRRVTDLDEWPAGRLRLARFGDIDEGLAVLLRDDWAQLMPHGGPRVVRLLMERLMELGASADQPVTPRELYPEAASDLEADMLAVLARAASPAAIDLLLAQPVLWREFAQRAVACRGGTDNASLQTILSRSCVLDHLIDPPSVVVVGRPNVGKSTLTNRILGRDASIVADLPGTTRDWVGGVAVLDGVAVRWVDTPGLRTSDDSIEAHAIDLARSVIAGADVLIEMRDPQIDWPAGGVLPRAADVRVVNKIDRGGWTAHLSEQSGGEALCISAQSDEGVDALVKTVVARLGLDALGTELWTFSQTLREIVTRNDLAALWQYADR